MAYRDPAIIWPAPGFPVFLEPHDRCLDLLVASRHTEGDTLSGWARQIALRDPAGKITIPLTLEEHVPATAREIEERATQFAILSKGASRRRSRI